MQDYITKQSLTDLDIHLSDADADSLIEHFNDVVEEMIGDEITELLSDAELEELVMIQESSSDEEIGKWISTHVPDYEQIVSNNIDIAIADMIEAAETLSSATEQK